MNDNTQRAQFERDGFLVCENILDAATVDCLNLFSDTVLAEQDAEHFERHRTTGSMVLIDWVMAYENLVLGELPMMQLRKLEMEKSIEKRVYNL